MTKKKSDTVDITKIDKSSGLYKFTAWCVKHRLGLTIWGIVTIFFGIGAFLLTLGIIGYLAREDGDDEEFARQDKKRRKR